MLHVGKHILRKKALTLLPHQTTKHFLYYYSRQSLIFHRRAKYCSLIKSKWYIRRGRQPNNQMDFIPSRMRHASVLVGENRALKVQIARKQIEVAFQRDGVGSAGASSFEDRAWWTEWYLASWKFFIQNPNFNFITQLSECSWFSTLCYFLFTQQLAHYYSERWFKHLPVIAK